ncbi:hypothetical protein HAX54_033910 [Datura stramonium]|uniref:Uncharacterized protein n=1 Tax=Datura stramonium TaxID=4076 RepID=A0ABS8VG94_DATST|nr:hypothetical protein [Datura stramonium]
MTTANAITSVEIGKMLMTVDSQEAIFDVFRVRRTGHLRRESGAMASCADKDKEVAIASKGFKRLWKGVASSSLAQKVSLLGDLEPRMSRSRGSNGSVPEKKPIMSRRIGLIKVIWRLSSPPFMTPLVLVGTGVYVC